MKLYVEPACCQIDDNERDTKQTQGLKNRGRYSQVIIASLWLAVRVKQLNFIELGYDL